MLTKECQFTQVLWMTIPSSSHSCFLFWTLSTGNTTSLESCSPKGFPSAGCVAACTHVESSAMFYSGPTFTKLNDQKVGESFSLRSAAQAVIFSLTLCSWLCWGCCYWMLLFSSQVLLCSMQADLKFCPPFALVFFLFMSLGTRAIPG